MTRRICYTLSALLACVSTAAADVKPHALFTDHMVFQRGEALTVWGTAKSGESVEVKVCKGSECLVEGKAATDEKGNWSVTLHNKVPAGAGYVMVISGGDTKIELKDVACGDVWLCSGQSNMEWRLSQLKIDDQGSKVAAAAANPMIRLFDVPNKTFKDPQSTVNSKWLECKPETVINFSAVGYFFGREIEKTQKVPVGLISSDWGGTPAEAWTSIEKLSSTEGIKHYLAKRDQMIAAAGDKPLGPNTPASLYNGMIAPLLKYKIKGAIWYQGESNAGRAAEYRTLFPAMIEDWRAKWGYDFPFFLVQLAPFRGGASGVDYAELRDAQWLATKKLKNVGMAVITDVGHETDIHPQKKEPVGVRLAIAARALAYGEKIEFSGPQFESVMFEGNQAIVSFTHVGQGLMAKGEELTGFTVCDESGKFVPAKATIKGDKVVVSAESVTKPTAVRFGWVNFAKPELNFFNKDGLPAVPFRTDDFPLTTLPKAPAKGK